MYFGVEQGDSLAVGGEDVDVAAGLAFDEAVAAEAGEVVAHLVRAVVGAQQMIHLGTEAPIGESEDSDGDAESAEQGHDPRVAETHGWGPLPVRGKRGDCDPLKGWARKNTTLPDTFSIK